MWKFLADCVGNPEDCKGAAGRAYRDKQFGTCIVPGVKRGVFLPIDARQRIYLWRRSGNGPRFVALFQATWRRLPLWVRRRILRHWRTHHRMTAMNFSPRIVLLDLDEAYRHEYKPGGDRPEQSEVISGGRVGLDGHSVEFNSNIIDVLPDNIVCDLVAHELAHVLQSASAIRDVVDTETWEIFAVDAHGDRISAGEVEDDADDCMAEWGFDPQSFDTWCHETGRCRRIEVTPTEFAEAVERFYETGVRCF